MTLLGLNPEVAAFSSHAIPDAMRQVETLHTTEGGGNSGA